ncbi:MULTISPECIES: hypothetical protein [Rhodopseudomonas]|jgi:hypothetical protein|uniref:Uncharacterized protein n=2 Tax=Rhodopseudomonas palustris TaxID=1076 RepID=Q6N0E4_RHOPA|nr:MULTISPECIES: hypothetical protein [Rhodopseudomonas]ACF03792.1 hypothetical protein Rpal_5306 [Rhodopseudomonas palustris TIE-1]AVT78847.1 hypothetical protein RPPS3_47850 [Rhodopseudomonas palustris]NEV79210.1 hypothetical protein [Rhodopseudomonas sp. BR0C11]NEW98945.1 hypothetical protein [Rhodopseudomonas sp. BR0G17]OPF95682.1 hypothetical protein B1S06_05860 [Rhodopseudomonas palustris]
MTDQSRPPERPRYEPEIIPPGQTHDPMGTRIFIDQNTTEHVFVGKVGPLGLFLMALAIGAVIAVVLVLLLGAFLLWIPVVGLLIAAGLVAGVLRPLFSRNGG